MNNRIPSTDR